MSKRRGPKALGQSIKLVELPATAGSENVRTFVAEPLPATPACANCTELRKLLGDMRVRIDEVEYAYLQLKTERDALLERLAPQGTRETGIEVVSDLPLSNMAR